MTWMDLIDRGLWTIVSPWVGGRLLQQADRVWRIAGDLPNEAGWYRFEIQGRRAKLRGPASPNSDVLRHVRTGYLVGDRFVPETARVPRKLGDIVRETDRVHLVELGVDRFARISAGRTSDTGPLIFKEEEMPLGPEEQVLSALLEGQDSVNDVADVSPALDAAFQMEVWRKKEVVRRRREIERRVQEEEERRRKEELQERLGSGEARRQMARSDFEAAARAALLVSGAEYLEHRPSAAREEMIVRFRLDRQRYECACDRYSLRITDAGVCLVDHESGERGDDRFTLESLPGVIRQAEREGALVVFRHMN